MPSTSTLAVSTRGPADFAASAVRHLEEFVSANAGVDYAVLTTSDGFEVAAHPKRPLTQKLAAMSSSLQALSEAITRESGLTNSRNLVIEAETGTIIVLGLANTQPRMSLALVCNNSETLGRLLWAARNCCAKLESLQRS
jgi:predicted regulator of Ras-like GTPase activity (Roadblock/LC7/MglB family)